MAARLAGGYAAVRRAINEVTNKCHRPACIPVNSSLLLIMLNKCPYYWAWWFLVIRQNPSCLCPKCLFFPTVTDKDERSLFCPSVSPGFWFRAGNSGLVSINTSKARESCHVEYRSVTECLPQGVTLMLGRHFEGDGVRGQLGADERPCWATSQMCGTQTLSPVLSGFSQIRIHKLNSFFWVGGGGAGDEENAEPHIKHVYFRQFLPVSPKVKLGYFHFSDIPHKLPLALDVIQVRYFTL